jgi:hypothetical protein
MKNSAICVMLILFAAACENTAHNTGKIDEKADPDIISENDEDTIETPAVFDVKVEQNEKNVLSCRLTFKTKEKMKMVVRYFSKDHKGYEIVEEDGKTDHYFFLWGMRAEKKYTIEIYSADEPDKLLETAQYESGSLPATTPFTFLAVNDREKVMDGFVMFTFSASVEEMAVPLALMLDTEGEVVWYFEYYMAGFNILGDMQFIEENSTILISLTKGPNMAEIAAEEAIEIDIEGNVLWKSREFPNVYGDDNSWHHMYERLTDDTLVFFRRDLAGTLVSDRILNVDRDYNELWTWRYLDHFEAPECDPAEWCDWTHSNTVTMFKDEGVVYLNSRNMSKYLKIDMYSGDILWTFGKDGDFVIDSDDPNPWFEFAHDPEIRSFDDDTIIFYDNGSIERGFSRVIEYKLNFEEMTAEVSFVYDGSYDGKMWFTEYWGDADTLPGGNIFVTAGAYDLEQDSRLFEVTREGEVVWELFMDKQESWMYTLYNAQKFIPPLKQLD